VNGGFLNNDRKTELEDIVDDDDDVDVGVVKDYRDAYVVFEDALMFL
jgi:hypothetical protein